MLLDRLSVSSGKVKWAMSTVMAGPVVSRIAVTPLDWYNNEETMAIIGTVVPITPINPARRHKRGFVGHLYRFEATRYTTTQAEVAIIIRKPT